MGARTLSSAVVGVAGLAAGLAHAQQQFSTYLGPPGTNWSVSGVWSNLNPPDSPGEVPLIPGGGWVRLNYSVTVDKIGMGAGAQISVNDNTSLGILTQNDNLGVTGIFGGGTIALDSVGNGTFLRLVGAPGTWAIHGAAGNPTTIRMSNTTANIITGSSVGVLFINEGTIEGAGQLGANTLDMQNQITGEIRALYSNPLIIDPGPLGMTNRGIMRAAPGGRLQLINGGFTQIAPAAIYADGPTSRVDIINSTIVGGLLQSLSLPSGGFYATQNSHLDSCRVHGAFFVPDNNLLFVTNFLEIPGYSVSLDSVGNGTYLRITGDVELRGTGTIQMSDSLANTIDGTAAGQVLTNNLQVGIFGSGRIGANVLTIINNGDISAQGINGLIIDPGAGGLTNNGDLYCLAGSHLQLVNGTFTNTSRPIIVQNDALCTISGAVVDGGTLACIQPNSSFRALANSRLKDVTTIFQTVIRTPDNNLTHWQGSINNPGTIELNSVGNGTYFRTFGGDVTLSGGGVLSCSNTTANIIDASVTNERLTLTNHTIRGSCSLGLNTLAVTNNALIEAVGSAGITIDPPSGGFENNAIVRATTGSAVRWVNGLFDNLDGLFEIQTGATGSIGGATVTGGTLTTIGTGLINCTGNSTIVNPTITGGSLLNTPDNNLNFWQGTVSNAGTIQLNSVGNGTYFRTTGGDVTLSGGGVLSCSNTTANIIDASVTNQRLTLTNHTIRGSCSIGANSLAATNNALIEGVGSAGITIDPPSGGFENNSIVRATTGSAVRWVSGLFDNLDGLFEIQDGATGAITSATVTGGTLTTIGTGVIATTLNSTIVNPTITGGSLLNTPDNNLNFWQGTVSNAGTIQLNSVGNGTYFRTLGGDVTLTGGGVMVCSNTTANFIDASVSNQRLTLTNHTIRGSCSIGANSLAITNNGSIIADSSAGMIIDPPSSGFLNDTVGLLRAAGGNITIGFDPFTTAGTVIAELGFLINRAAGSWVQTGGLVLAHGEIQVVSDDYQLQAGTLGGFGLVDSRVVNSGGTVAPGASAGTLTFEGNYTQGAGGTLAIEVGGLATSEHDRLIVQGSATLAGTLEVSLLAPYAPSANDAVTVLTATSRAGTFSTVSPPALGGLRPVASYTPTTVVLTFRCLADYDNGSGNGTPDGGVDIADLLYYLQLFDAGDVGADLDDGSATGTPDGGVDISDLLYFLDRFDGGC